MAKFAFSRNPAFATNAAGGVAAAQNISAQQLDELYKSPSAPESEVMTVEDTLAKTVGAFAILLVGAAVGWISGMPLLWIGAAVVGLVLGLVNSFKREPSAPLILIYAAVEGIFIGGISSYFESFLDGVVVQAVIATLVVIGVTLALFASGKIRASKRATKIFLIAMIGYGLFSLINFGLVVTGIQTDPYGLRGSANIAGIPLGIVLGVFVVIMAAYSLVLDFDFIQRGVNNKAPRRYGWTGAFGIMATVIWLYLEILRMFAIARR